MTVVDRSFREADRLAVALAAARSWLTVPLARAAEPLVNCERWMYFGYARASDYSRERLHRSGRWLCDLARLGEALERLPHLADALSGEDGQRPLGRVAAQWIGKIASARSVASWIDLARRVTVRELREEIKTARSSGSTWPLDADEAGALEDIDRGAASPIPTDSDQSETSHGAPRPSQPGLDTHLERFAGGEPGCSEVSSEISLSDDPLDEPCRVRMSVPAPVRAAFEEGLEIHRAVTGRESSVASFIEAMVAETYAGPHPPDVETVPVRHAEAREAVERRMAWQTETWQDLERNTGDAGILEEASLFLIRVRTVSARAGLGDERDLDNQLRILIGLEDEIECLLGRFLVEMGERGAWSDLRFSGVGHYAEQRLGLSRTSAEDRTGLARALRSLPVLRKAYELGRVGFESALLLRRILGSGPIESTIETEWVTHAQHVTVRRLKDEVRMIARELSENPALRGAGAADRNDLKGNSSQVRERHSSPAPMSGTARAKEWMSPPGDASWRDALYRSPGMAISRLARLGQAAARGDSPDVFLHLRLPEDVAGSFLSAVESRRRALAMSAAEGGKDGAEPPSSAAEGSMDIEHSGPSGAELPMGLRMEEGLSGAQGSASAEAVSNGEAMARAEKGSGSGPWSRSEPGPIRVGDKLTNETGSQLAARTFSQRGQAVPVWAGLLALVEEFVATWDDPKQSPKRAADAVYKRDGWRCTAPGCLSRSHLEEHHIRYRSQGGSNDLENRICACTFHHREGEHGGFARVRGTAPYETHWTLGRLGSGGAYLNDRRLGGLHDDQDGSWPFDAYSPHVRGSVFGSPSRA